MAECIGVLGAGSWGTALAILLAGNGQRTVLWDVDPEHVARMLAEGQNQYYLPGIDFPPNLELTHDLRESVAHAGDILVVVPSHAFRDVLEKVRSALQPDSRVAWATKGLEPGTGRPLHEVARELLGEERPIAVLSGPSFAKEVAAGLPTAVTVASNNSSFARDLALRVHNDRFRVYLNPDMVGVELGGSVKNVLAIGAGIAHGLGFGANTRAALITRGLAEMMRLGEAMGAHRDTFMGLAGIGDLVLTCTDTLSRNLRMGLSLAKGMGVDEAAAEIGEVVEGVATAREVKRLAERYAIEMPICDQVYRVLHQGLAPMDAVQTLLAREDAQAELS